MKQSGPGDGAGPKLGSGPGTKTGLGANPEADIGEGLGACPSTDPSNAVEKMKAARRTDTQAIAALNK